MFFMVFPWLFFFPVVLVATGLLLTGAPYAFPHTGVAIKQKKAIVANAFLMMLYVFIPNYNWTALRSINSLGYIHLHFHRILSIIGIIERIGIISK